MKTLKKTSDGVRSPYTLLLLTALLLPCVNTIFIGGLMLVCDYFGAFYSYNAAGTVLTVLAELLSSIFNVIKSCATVFTVLTLCAYLMKTSLKKAIPAALAALAMGLADLGAGIGTLGLTVALGVSDSTAALPNQLLPSLMMGLFGLLSTTVIYALALLAVKLIKSRSADHRLCAREKKTPFHLFSLIFIGVWTLYLLIDPLIVVLTSSDQGNFFTAHVLPLFYPLIYGGFLLILTGPALTILVGYFKGNVLRGKKGQPGEKA